MVLDLKVVAVFDRQQHVGESFIVDVGHDVAHCVFESGFIDQFCDFFVELVVVVWSDVAEIVFYGGGMQFVC